MAFVVAELLGVFLLAIATNAARVPAGQLVCAEEGYWPDPDDCTQYHVCVRFPNANPEYVDVYAGQCEDDLAYDPQTTACRFHLDDPVCTRGPVTCNFPGHWGVVVEAPAMYWVCDNYLRPVYRECEAGFVFSGKECEEDPTTPAPSGPRPPANGVCFEPGVWADPTDCRAYYTCSTKLKLKRQRCTSHYHFDSVIVKCAKGSCTNE